MQSNENDNNVPVMYENLKNNSGYVILSASTLETSVLAYSDNGKFYFGEINEFIGIANWVASGHSIISIKKTKNPVRKSLINGKHWVIIEMKKIIKSKKKKV